MYLILNSKTLVVAAFLKAFILFMFQEIYFELFSPSLHFKSSCCHEVLFVIKSKSDFRFISFPELRQSQRISAQRAFLGCLYSACCQVQPEAWKLLQ